MPILQNSTVLYDLLEEMGAHVVSRAARLRRPVGGAGDRAREIGLIRSEEAEAARLVHRLLGDLSGACLPPFDPQDVHVLPGELDIVIDDLDALSQRVDTYRLPYTEPRFVMQIELLVRPPVYARRERHRGLRPHRQHARAGRVEVLTPRWQEP